MNVLDGNYGIERGDIVDIVLDYEHHSEISAAVHRYNYGAIGHGDNAGWIVLSMPGGPGDVAQFCAACNHAQKIAVNLNAGHFVGLVKHGHENS